MKLASTEMQVTGFMMGFILGTRTPFLPGLFLLSHPS